MIVNNALVQADDGLYRVWFSKEAIDYWPLTNSLFWIEWRLWGHNSTGYHSVNLGLHIVECWLIWWILWRLSIPGAYFAALLFAVHPVNVETVAWIAQLKNLLAMMFFLISVLLYLEADHRTHRWPPARSILGNGWYWASLAAFVLALLSKGSVAILPCVLLLLIWWRRRLTASDLAAMAPFLVAAAILTAVNMWFQTRGEVSIRDVTFVERLLGAGAVVWFYLWKALLPLHLMFVYPQWTINAATWYWWMPLLAVAIVTVVLWKVRNTRFRHVFVAWAYFCICLIPVLGFTDVYYMRYSLVADHYQHLALIAAVSLMAGVVVWLSARGRTERLLGTVVMCAAVATCAVLTWRESRAYADMVTLYQTTLDRHPDSWLVNSNLGNLLDSQGRFGEALPYFEKAWQLEPDHPRSNYNLGTCLVHLGKFEDAQEYLERTVQIEPNHVLARNNLGYALVRCGRPAEGAEQLEKVLEIQEMPEAHYNLGIALVALGRTEDAIKQYEQALRLRQDFGEVHLSLGGVYMDRLDHERAIEHLRRAATLMPNSFPALNMLTLEYAATDQHALAITTAERAIAVAKARGETILARQIESWLAEYKVKRSIRQ